MITKQQIDEHLSALKEYFFIPLKKIFIGEKKIKTLFDLEEFIQTKSAIITQHTLYGYLKTRIGTRHVMLFGDEQFSKSIDIAKWNIYTVSIQDLCLYCFSYLASNNLCSNMDLATDVFHRILDGEKKNGLEDLIYQNAIKDFDERKWPGRYATGSKQLVSFGAKGRKIKSGTSTTLVNQRRIF